MVVEFFNDFDILTPLGNFKCPKKMYINCSSVNQCSNSAHPRNAKQIQIFQNKIKYKCLKYFTCMNPVTNP